MKTSISRHLSILPLAGLSLVALMCFSCSPEVEISVPQPTAPETAFVVSAAARPQSDTRAIVEGGIDDNLVDEITILLFDATSNFYVRSASVATVTRAGTSPTEWLWRFSMSVPAGDYKALFLANAAEIVAARYDLAEGKEVGSGKSMKTLSIEQIALSLARAFGEGEKYNAEPTDTAGGYAPFVMSSGQVTFSLPLASPDHFSNNPVKLSRDVAKINVEFASAGARAQLEISEIRLCNYNTRSCAVGTPALWTAWNGGEFTDPLFAAYAARPAGTVVTAGRGSRLRRRRHQLRG